MDDITTGTTTDPTAISAGSTGDQLDYKSLYEKALLEKEPVKTEDWQKRFTGLQGAYQRDQEKWKATQTELESTKKSLAELTTGKTSIEEALKARSEEYERLATEHEIASHQLDRLTIILTKYPALADFEAEGLLPDGTGEEFAKKLDIFAAKIGRTGKESIAKHLEGATPPTPGTTPATTSASLWQQAMTALTTGDTVAYDKLYTQFLEESKKENKK